MKTCECGQDFTPTNNAQRYCPDCGKTRRSQYKADWAREWRKRTDYEVRRRAENPERHRLNNHRRRGAGHISPVLARFLYSQPCWYCGAPGEHIEHRTPISRGGTSAADNLVSSCAPCNWRKGKKTELEYVRWLLTRQS